jgi:hypothetical protein
MSEQLRNPLARSVLLPQRHRAMSNWSITPRPKKFGELEGIRLEVDVEGDMSPSEAMHFALSLIETARRYVEIKDR